MTTQPKTNTAKVGHTKTVHISFEKDSLEAIRKIAKSKGLTCAAWIRMVALKSAEKIL